MKILALRVREVGCFAAPVALEGLSGGLDVLAGPNEAGKSTLFRALRTALLWKHTAGGEAIEGLRPYSGGSPMVEVDLEAAGMRYRLRKQFGAGRSAQLTDLARGSVLARGADADAEVARLIDAAGASGRTVDMGRHGLLWVEQGKSLAQPAAGEALSAAVSRLIETEAATVADGVLARAVLARAEVLLGADITAARGTPKAGSAYARALEEREAWRLRVAAAAARLTETAATRDRLVDARRRLAERHGVEPRQRANDAEGRAREAIEAARKAVVHLKDAEKDAAFARERLAAAEAARTAFEQRVRRLAACETDLASARVGREAARTSLNEVEAQASAAAAALEQAQARLDELSALAVARAQAEQRAQQRRRRGEITAALARHEALSRQVRQIEDQLPAIAIDAAALDALERAAARARDVATRLAAAAASVEVAYVEAPRGLVRIDGSAVAGGAKMLVDGTLRLDIEGVGAIVITAGSGVDFAGLNAELTAADGECAARLRAAGCATLEEARVLLEQRRELSAQRERLAAELRAVCPAGPQAMQMELAALPSGFDTLESAAAVDAGAEPAAVSAAAAAAAAALDQARNERARAVRDNDEAARRLEQARVRAATLDGAILRHEAMLAEIAGALPVPQARAETLAGLAAAQAAQREILDDAIRSRDAWSAAVPKPEAMRALESDLAGLISARQRMEAERAQLERQIALDEAALERDGEQEVESVHAEAVEALARAVERVAGMELEHEALRLVIALVKEESAARRSSYLVPVMARLVPMISQLMPGAGVTLGDSLSVTGLIRAGAVEAVERLSDGTREQIAVLVRLAFARVLADAGTPAPLVLDDALVFSDDARLGRMFELIGQASRHAQVIVLSCQEARVGALARAAGGRVLRLAPWQADAAAA